MTWNLLAFPWQTVLLWVFVIGAVIALWFFSKRSQQKREEEINNTLNAIQPGNKVKTIGGICGVVVELCPEDNTFILETGSETTGKSYIKFDKKAVYQTDAVANAAVEEAPVEQASEEAPFEEVVEETPAEEVAEAPVEEATEAPAEETETNE